MNQALMIENLNVSSYASHEALRACGFQTDIAKTGHDGLQCLRRKRYHLILIDVLLPDLTGVDVADEIHSMYQASQIHPNAKIAFIASLDIADKYKKLHHFVEKILTKPLTADSITALTNI